MAETDPKSVQDLTAVVSFKHRVAKLGEAGLVKLASITTDMPGFLLNTGRSCSVKLY